MSSTPTGRRETRDFGEAVVLDRRFRAPVEDVWASLTEPARLQRWVGTWSGDPASGEVVFRMTAEGEEAPEEPLTILECRPPHVLRTQVRVAGDGTGDSEQLWHWELALEESDGMTTLTFAQSTAGDVPVSDVGPGWEYYLDRLVVDRDGGDVATVDWARDYYPAMKEHYTQLFS